MMPRITSREIDEAVLRILKSAAKKGSPTPSNTECSREIGVSHYSVSRSFARLHERGFIVVRNDGGSRRQVTVPGFGETAWTLVTPRNFKRDPVTEGPKPLRAPAATGMVGHCFDDVRTTGGGGTVNRPATHVPTSGVLA